MWCPTTTLGTWTAEQNGEYLLTGNSTYGAGVEKMAQSAGVPLAVMEPIAEGIFARYVGIKGIQDMAQREAQIGQTLDGVPYIHTPGGNRLFIDPDRMYSSANYKIQGYAAVLMKKALVNIRKAGLGDLLRLVVHDEAVLRVPTEDTDEVSRILQDAMSISAAEGFAVDIPAVPEAPTDRWEPH